MQLAAIMSALPVFHHTFSIMQLLSAACARKSGTIAVIVTVLPASTAPPPMSSTAPLPASSARMPSATAVPAPF